MKQIDGRVIDQGARGRRNNVLFHGITETDGENCEQKVKDFIKKYCKLSNTFVFEACHRLGRNKTGNIGTATRPVIAKFLNRADKELVMRTKKDLPDEVGMTQDFPLEIRLARKQLIPRMLQEKEAGKKAVIVYPCRLIVDGKEVMNIDPTSITV